MSSERARFVAIALIAAAVILYEILITRILSVVQWYHWSFLSVSLAMLGLGSPGVWLAMSRAPKRFLQPALVVGAIGAPLSVVLILRYSHLFGAYGPIFCMVNLLVPLLGFGTVVCLLLLEAPGRQVARMYGLDLLGACLGALAVIPLLNSFPTPKLVAAVGLLPLVARVALLGRVSKLTLFVGAMIVGLMVWGSPLELSHSKTYQEVGGLKPLYVRWTPTARIAIFDHLLWTSDASGAFSWGVGSEAPKELPSGVTQYWLEQDASAGTAITSFDGDLGKLGFLAYDVTSVGYQVRSPRSVAIIGAGGGRDILTALLFGADEIDAIELNRHTVEVLSTRFKEFTGDIYHRPGVNAVVDEGRSYLTRTERRYDVIQVSLIDSWAATSAGAYALSENTLYTEEAFGLYLNRASATGLISVSRWITGGFGIEFSRLILLAKAALNQSGSQHPERHIALVQAGTVGTLLMSKRPWSVAEIKNLEAVCRLRGFTLHHPTRLTGDRRSLSAKVLQDGAAGLFPAGINLEPPVDDKPFFFQVVSPFSLVNDKTLAALGQNGQAVSTLQLLMKVVAGVTVAFFFLPFLFGRWFRPGLSDLRGTTFYACIGAAFMLVEIPWLQRFIQYLGHPSYATTVVLGAMLLGAAIGAMLSARVGLQSIRRFGLVTPAAVVLQTWLQPVVFDATIGWGLELRVAVAIALVAPVALLMGAWFPAGFSRFGDERKAWFWAANGAVGVLASVLSLALSMEIGFSSVAQLGAVCYCAAWVMLLGRRTDAVPARA